jgi:hypothetical protein
MLVNIIVMGITELYYTVSCCIILCYRLVYFTVPQVSHSNYAVCGLFHDDGSTSLPYSTELIIDKLESSL